MAITSHTGVFDSKAHSPSDPVFHSHLVTVIPDNTECSSQPVGLKTTSDFFDQTNLSNNTADEFHAVWSPDNSKIAFASDRDGDLEIYTMNADGSGQTRLTNDAGSDRFPA